MITLDLTIEQEAIEKLTNLLVKKDPTFPASETKNILSRIKLESSRDIHQFVIAINNLIKEIEPADRLSLGKIEANGNVLPLPELTFIEKALVKIKFANDDDRNIVFNYIKKSLN